MTQRFTPKQGQYLAFIHHYKLIHGQAPAEADMQQYFRTSPPSVHQMVLALEKRGLIARTPGQARSIVLRGAADELPPLGEAGTASARESQVHSTCLCARNDPDGADAQEDAETCRRLMARGTRAQG